MRLHYIVLILIPLLMLVGSVAVMGQTDAGMCPALVEQALADLGSNCDSLDRNSACYGFNRVDATFVESQAEGFFSNPADRTTLVALDTIQTAPLDTDEERWGIAVLNVQANVPNTLPGQAVVFMLMGDVEVDNAVAPEDALELGPTIDATTLVAANLRSAPSTNANVVGSVSVGTSLTADGISPDSGWLRVLYAGGPAWVSRQVVDEEGDAASLPVISRASRTPMQAFTFRTGVGQPTCVESPPSLLLVQGPENVRVDITANGADIQIGSTIVLWLLPGNLMQLVVVSGEARVGNLTIPAGFTITTDLNEDGTGQGDDGWSGFRPLTDEELSWLLPLELIPPHLLHYPIFIPTRLDIQRVLAALQAARGGGTGAGGGNISGPAAGLVDCSNFRATSPLDGMNYGQNTFYWDGAPGATNYQVNVYDEQGNLVASGQASAPNTSLTMDVLGGTGISYSWQVSALVNGQVACTTVPITMLREAAPPPPTSNSGSGSGGSSSCGRSSRICEPGDDESCPECFLF